MTELEMLNYIIDLKGHCGYLECLECPLINFKKRKSCMRRIESNYKLALDIYKEKYGYISMLKEVLKLP